MRGRATTAGSPRARARVGIPARARPPAPTPGPTGSRDLSGFPRSLGGQMPAAAGRPPAPTHPGVSHPPEFSELADDRRTGAPQSPARLKARGSRARKGAASRSTPASGRPPCPPEERSSPRKSGAPHANRALALRALSGSGGIQSGSGGAVRALISAGFRLGGPPFPPGRGAGGTPQRFPPLPPSLDGCARSSVALAYGPDGAGVASSLRAYPLPLSRMATPRTPGWVGCRWLGRGSY